MNDYNTVLSNKIWRSLIKKKYLYFSICLSRKLYMYTQSAAKKISQKNTVDKHFTRKYIAYTSLNPNVIKLKDTLLATRNCYYLVE